MTSTDPIVNKAIDLLLTGTVTIKERDASYNGNGVGFADYQIRDLDSAVEEVLENFVRLWQDKTANREDKAVDMVCYTALMAACMIDGFPASRFAPIMRKVVPPLYKAIKEMDEADAEVA